MSNGNLIQAENSNGNSSNDPRTFEENEKKVEIIREKLFEQLKSEYKEVDGNWIKVENSNGNSSNEPRTFEEMERLEILRKELLEQIKPGRTAVQLTVSGEQLVKVLLSCERTGRPPSKKGEIHHLKAKFPTIGFRTPEWQEWVSECIDLSICD